jgi:hypothetical protein
VPITPNQTPSTPNKKHIRKAKYQIRQKIPNTPNMQKKTKYSKIFIYAVLSQKKNTHFVGVLFTDVKSMVVYKNGQISGMAITKILKK